MLSLALGRARVADAQRRQSRGAQQQFAQRLLAAERAPQGLGRRLVSVFCSMFLAAYTSAPA